MKRYELMHFTNRGGEPDAKMSPAVNGEWVKYEDAIESSPMSPAVWIWWSEEDKAYLCSIPCKPHFGGRVIGHGDTEVAALIMAKNAQVATLEAALEIEEGAAG